MYIIMFFCNTCFVEPQRDSQSQVSAGISIITDDSDKGGNNSVMIKTSLYNKYMMKCKNGLFTDPEFPPDQKSLGYQPHGRQVVWKRITEIVKDCVLFEGGIEETDVQMGNLGDVYFLPTVAALARSPNRIKTVFYLSTEIEKKGIYRLLVKDAGIIRQLVIDDYVPVYRDSGRPVFCKAHGQEVWVMLMEKAWAKLKGSYGAMLTGCPHQVLTAFCIGPCRSYDLTNKNQDLEMKVWRDLKEAHKNNYIVCATSSIYPKMHGLAERRIFNLLELSQSKGKPQIKLHNYWSEEMPVVSRLTKVEGPLKSEIYSPSGRSSTTAIRIQNEQIILSLREFIENFDRIDISHENGRFSFEFIQIQMRPSPIFVEFVVQEQHKAYISISKPRQNNLNLKHGFIRLMLAESRGEEEYRLEALSSETQFEDCFIHVNFTIGKHVLMINADFPPGSRQALTLSYSWEKVSVGSKTEITQLEPPKLPIYSFFNSVFSNHAYEGEGAMLNTGNDLIRCVSLFEQCGYGYVICRVPSKANFRFEVSINQSLINKSGIKLFGQWGQKISVRAGQQQVFIFQLVSEELDTNFPPQGFSVCKII